MMATNLMANRLDILGHWSNGDPTQDETLPNRPDHIHELLRAQSLDD